MRLGIGESSLEDVVHVSRSKLATELQCFPFSCWKEPRSGQQSFEVYGDVSNDHSRR